MNYVNPVSLFCILNLFLITNYLVKKSLNLSQISINLLQKKTWQISWEPQVTNFFLQKTNDYYCDEGGYLNKLSYCYVWIFVHQSTGPLFLVNNIGMIEAHTCI
jgi:hypothetical protein